MFSQFLRLSGSFVSASLVVIGLSGGAAKANDDGINSNQDWDGIFLSASVGGGVTRGSASALVQRESRLLDTTTRSETGSDYNAVPTADLFAAINHQIAPRYVAGLRLEGSVADIDFSSKGKAFVNFRLFGGVNLANPPTTPQVADVRLHRTISVLARLGWIARPGQLLYGLVGWTHGRFSIELTPRIDDQFQIVSGGQVVCCVAPPIEKNGFGADGITVGGGFEKKLGDSWSVLTEYRYLRFAGISHFQARSSIPPPTFSILTTIRSLGSKTTCTQCGLALPINCR